MVYYLTCHTCSKTYVGMTGMMMEPPPENHSTHPTEGITEDKVGAKKKKKLESEYLKLSSKLDAATNNKVLTWLHRIKQDMLAEYKEEEDVITIYSD